ncbi:FMN-binding negative transcriptional regulator [Streptomyces sp. NPDC126514]|uniref:FMN-binding negative transcriptional regulator n=1 Tax=Streptomyces sp. NPDC126514 TaxID=3155210 RepID=UPI00332A439F
MFVPELYRCADPTWHAKTIRGYPLATLTSNGPRTPFATHVPVIAPHEVGDCLVGIELTGHMNRANPHWAALHDGTPARLMFDGPCGYITPTLYRTGPAAPTWDFTSVHVRGTVQLIEDRDETLDVVCRTAETFEEAFGDSWDQASSLDYFRSILPGVGAFRLRVEEVDGMYKLSQEKPRQVQERVIKRFESSNTGLHRSLAEVMRGFGLGEP